jgi:hypothetical protein
VGSLWKAAIDTNISCDCAHIASQIRKILTTTSIDIILKKTPKNHFKKLMSGEPGVREHISLSRKRQGLEIHYNRF